MVFYLLIVVSALLVAMALVSFFSRDDSVLLPDFPAWPPGSMPFMIIPHEEIESPDLNNSLHETIAFWNRVAPGTFASLGRVSMGAVIVVMPSYLCDREVNYAWTQVIEDEEHGIVSTAIYLNPEKIADPELHIKMIHELGHVLGIRHVDDPDSVMHKNATSSVPNISQEIREHVLALSERLRVDMHDA